jgi:hypothetical protein
LKTPRETGAFFFVRGVVGKLIRKKLGAIEIEETIDA